MSQAMTMSEAEVKKLVDGFYLKLDVHAPTEEILPLLADEGLEMRFPEGTLHNHRDFRKWYEETIVTRFFDEVHTMKELKIAISGDRADVQLVVNWQAHIWDPPAPKSQWLGFDAFQTWVVEPSKETQRPVITRYVVDKLVPMEGSASL